MRYLDRISSAHTSVGTDWDLSDIGAWSQWWDGESQVCGVGCDKVATTESVGDLITDDDSIRFLRGTPSEHYGGELGLTSEVRHNTRNC